MPFSYFKYLISSLFLRCVYRPAVLRLADNVEAASLAVAGFHRRSDESQRCKVKQNFGRDKPAIARNRLLRDGRFGTPKKKP